MSRLNDLASAGTAVWLDFVERDFLERGGLQKLIDDDAVTGVTSNPAIFEQAIGHSKAYDTALANFDQDKPNATTVERYEYLAVQDIRAAAQILFPVYERTRAGDGYVSLEVSPYLADDAGTTIAEAQRLWDKVARPNLMIKIPGTQSGATAITASIAAGINVNVTLLFSLEAYARVVEAYVAGLEVRLREGQPIDRIASVASFFISRIDSKIDQMIDRRVSCGDAEAGALQALRGKIAIANAKLAYAWYVDFIASERWQALAARGAMPQRLLWASTGVKDPTYADTMYIDELIGTGTVHTIPPKTLDAYRDHGTAAETLTTNIQQARHIFSEAERLKLDLRGVTDQLAHEGVVLFSDAFDRLLDAVKNRR